MLNLRRTSIAIFVLVPAVLSLARPAIAHHSFGMFDKNKLANIKGVVSRFEWTNPHVYITTDVPNGKGGAIHYTIEGPSITMLNRAGWKMSSIKVGDPIQVHFYPLKSGEPGGLLDRVALANGTILKWQ